MKKKLYYYHIDAIEKIYNYFDNGGEKAKIYISTGLGKTSIIVGLVERIFDEKGVVPIIILTSRRQKCNQIIDSLHKNIDNVTILSNIKRSLDYGIFVTTYQNILLNGDNENISKAKLIICDDAHFMKNEKFNLIFNKNKFYLGILPTVLEKEGWFENGKCIFRYTVDDAIKDEYIPKPQENDKIIEFVEDLLNVQGYIKHEINSKLVIEKNVLPDIIMEKNGYIFIFEIKLYRGIYNSYEIISNAINQSLLQKQRISQALDVEKIKFGIFMFCKIDDELKRNLLYKDLNIWDISNIIYLCDGDEDLVKRMERNLNFSITNIIPQEPIWLMDKNNEGLVVSPLQKEAYESVTLKFAQQLEKCDFGRENQTWRKYEKICTEILLYLFDTEFSQISEQHRTNGDMFRMDLLCAVKGTTEFWKFLIQFYHTKFVVFEYKNYSKPISQNLIYITEKYLFPIALRNVAFIISRKGFDDSAEKAALGCLRENGKLIISLTDEDLIKMVNKKEVGEEPSDYLLNKVENLLMAVSK